MDNASGTNSSMCPMTAILVAKHDISVLGIIILY
jgi:hypothetical protein